MPVTLTADLPQVAAFPVGGSASTSVPWDYLIADTAASTALGPICTSPSYPARDGQIPSMTATLRVPVGKPGLKVRVAYTYLDAALAVLSTADLLSFTATSSAAAQVLTLPVVPAGARWWYVTVWLDEGASDATVRTNLFTAPRASNPFGSIFLVRNSWAIGSLNGFSPTPVPGLNTSLQATCNTAGAATFRGMNLWQAPDGTTPTAATGMAVTPGQTLTISAYVRSSKAVTAALAVRFFSGTTWTAAATSGTGVALTANVWSRVSVTVTVPAGASYMCGAIWVPASVSWMAGDSVAATGVLVEVAGTAGTYFDGSYTPDSNSARWTGTANASSSELYVPGEARARHLVLTSVTVRQQADAEELLSATLTRPLRRSVYDVLNEAAPQISVGTPALLAGSILYLCEDLETALAFDAIYQLAGVATLATGTDEALDGFRHMAVGELKLAAEKALPGKPSRWTVGAEVREVEAS